MLEVKPLLDQRWVALQPTVAETEQVKQSKWEYKYNPYAIYFNDDGDSQLQAEKTVLGLVRKISPNKRNNATNKKRRGRPSEFHLSDYVEILEGECGLCFDLMLNEKKNEFDADIEIPSCNRHIPYELLDKDFRSKQDVECCKSYRKSTFSLAIKENDIAYVRTKIFDALNPEIGSIAARIAMEDENCKFTSITAKKIMCALFELTGQNFERIPLCIYKNVKDTVYDWRSLNTKLYQLKDGYQNVDDLPGTVDMLKKFGNLYILVKTICLIQSTDPEDYKDKIRPLEKRPDLMELYRVGRSIIQSQQEELKEYTGRMEKNNITLPPRYFVDRFPEIKKIMTEIYNMKI